MRNQLAISILLITPVVVIGCTPKQNKNLDLNQILATLAPKLANAESVVIICQAPDSSDVPDPFAILVGEKLAKRIKEEGFPPAISKLARTNKRPEVTVVDHKDKSTSTADARIYFVVKEHDFDGQFSKREVKISRSFKADVWLYSSESKNPYTLTAGFSSTANATPPDNTEVEEIPSWSDNGYSDVPDIREEKFASEGADTIYETMNTVTDQIRSLIDGLDVSGTDRPTDGQK